MSADLVVDAGQQEARAARVAELARGVRENVVRMCRTAGKGYAGQGLELAEIVSCLFGDVMRGEAGSWRDRFVLSTGHDAIALYAVLERFGVYRLDDLLSYGLDGTEIDESPLEGAPGFEVTGGSLGQGLSQAVGMALAARVRGIDARVYCVVSDGELQEGQVWEALMSAPHFRLDNLVVLIDNNDMQADGQVAAIMTVEPVHERLAAFGYAVERLDGHDVPALLGALDRARTTTGRPTALVCDTIPGKGSPTMEAFRRVHYVNAPDQTWAVALEEIRASGDTA
jgi:transketolase